ncbi:hypothetical protein [Hymenobacter ruricola]|uniref:Uncharacterized protein n=1 Tax=Hymenobacter ruricola TaxID=2791023 RepID=A0ABS0I804_9BACT|nr:hypothetical protein [Hymenobacter ruricola]MBF9223042.1 hypothetical protein [Hymenobacter ruricola]
MATNRQLKIDLLKAQNDYSRLVEQVVQALATVDPSARATRVEQAVASRALVGKLWDLLPDEHKSFQFKSGEEMLRNGRDYLPATGHQQPVILHLGWDILSFSCSFEAAWLAWPDFHKLGQEAFNSCVYPANLAWYIIRAGTNLYPMVLENGQYCLKTTQSTL